MAFFHKLAYNFEKQLAQLSRETNLQGRLVLAKSGKLELGNRQYFVDIIGLSSFFNHCVAIDQQSYQIRKRTQNKSYYAVQGHSGSFKV